MEICSASPLLFSKPLGSMYILLLDNLAILEIHSQMQLEIGGMKSCTRLPELNRCF